MEKLHVAKVHLRDGKVHYLGYRDSDKDRLSLLAHEKYGDSVDRIEPLTPTGKVEDTETRYVIRYEDEG